MYRRVFNFTDFDGNKRTEEAFFNLTKAEVMMWISTNNEYTLDKLILELTRVGDVRRLMEIFEDLILRSYGRKSPDGRRFIKSKELSEEFKQTAMYSDLFMELVNNSEKSSEFVNAILPKDLSQDVDNLLKNKDNLPVTMQEYLNSVPAVVEAVKDQTAQEAPPFFPLA